MNILVLSAGTRNKVIQFFKKELGDNGRVIATDCSNLAPAVYDADKFILVNRITAPGYMDRVFEICREEKVDAVLSLIDPELSMIAERKDDFLAMGVTPIISDSKLVDMSFNKYEMAQEFDRQGFTTAKCFLSVEDFKTAQNAGEVNYPVFVKPVCGSASIHINKVNSDKELEGLFAMYDDLMIQEFMHGQEYGADVYIDMISGKCASIFIKKKIKMRAGETDKSVSVHIPELFEQIKTFVEAEGFRGIIDIDIFEQDCKFYFSEINPRFGGGYPHAYACGVNVPAQIINNLNGIENEVRIGDYKDGIVMMKYNEIMIRDMNGTELVP
ncbi:carbamoyl-phosphate synthase large subunit [Lachnospiraceae bacterium G11]|nr:carbamoyl-phosphate synthase large subunit [Lachnospiraceae bacterium G11]